MARIIWTRSKDRWHEDQKALPRGVRFIHIPLVDHVVLEQTWKIPRKSQLLVSSSLGAEIIMGDDRLLKLVKDCEVLTFSRRVADVMGPMVRVFPESSMESLLNRLIKDRVLHPKVPVFFLGAAKPAFPVEEFLSKHGFLALNIPLYETILLDVLKPEQLEVLEGPCVVCLASPSAVRALANLCDGYGIDVESLLIVTIGATTAREADKFFSQIRVCPQASVESLMEEAHRWSLAL